MAAIFSDSYSLLCKNGFYGIVCICLILKEAWTHWNSPEHCMTFMIMRKICYGEGQYTENKYKNNLYKYISKSLLNLIPTKYWNCYFIIYQFFRILLLDSCVHSCICCRNHDITMHKSDAAEKNEFLQDLDKNDVSLRNCWIRKLMCINDQLSSLDVILLYIIGLALQWCNMVNCMKMFLCTLLEREFYVGRILGN